MLYIYFKSYHQKGILIINNVFSENLDFRQYKDKINYKVKVKWCRENEEPALYTQRTVEYTEWVALKW